MNQLREKSNLLISQVDTRFKRYLYRQLPFGKRLLIVTGARGVGKTTMLLQYLKENFYLSDSVIYVTLDDIYFLNNSFYEFAKKFRQNGGKLIVIDEAHKYSNWAVEVKNLYDTYQDLKFIITGSSILSLYKSQADLSRRALFFTLQGLSFREFLELKYNFVLPVLSLNDIISRHVQIAAEFRDKLKFPIKYFKEYLKSGYYPFFIEESEEVFYYQRLKQVIEITLNNDLAILTEINVKTIQKLLKLLVIIAQSSPFKPNISKIAQLLDLSRDTLYKYFDLLQRASLIKTLPSSTRGIRSLGKIEKVFLENPNLFFALDTDNARIGSIRETFFMNQLSPGHKLAFGGKVDFLVDNKFYFEIGGANKTHHQITGIDNAYLSVDDIEIGFGKTIPLWLFGFLY